MSGFYWRWAMADTSVTQTDIANLARKLDELGDVLTAAERSLLLAVFKLASAGIAAKLQSGGTESGGSQTESGGGRVARPTTTANIPSLSAGFRDAFRSIGNGEITLRDRIGDVAGGVGIGVVY
jgi:hypothetical protein